MVNLLREKERELSPLMRQKIEIVEEGGAPLRHVLYPSNPWTHGPCKRQDFLICVGKVTGEEKASDNCYKRSVVYLNQFHICKSHGTVARYIGESARSSFERAKEHVSDCRSKKGKKTSHMKEHLRACHPEIDKRSRDEMLNTFNMRVTKATTSQLSRQLWEALLIQRAGLKGELLLNSKDEYTRCFIPMLHVDVLYKSVRSGRKVLLEKWA